MFAYVIALVIAIGGISYLFIDYRRLKRRETALVKRVHFHEAYYDVVKLYVRKQEKAELVPVEGTNYFTRPQLDRLLHKLESADAAEGDREAEEDIHALQERFHEEPLQKATEFDKV